MVMDMAVSDSWTEEWVITRATVGWYVVSPTSTVATLSLNISRNSGRAVRSSARRHE